MKILFITQALDLDDPTLSTYHEWVATLATRVESIEVICLKEGRHSLPENVRVHSLGKEHGRVPSFRYAFRFLSLAWKLRNKYDHVFVHMNQEYVLIAGWLWKLVGKPIYMWRNHYAGDWRTDAAAAFCVKVFCTSRHSYTAKYRKTKLMPVGVDMERFTPEGIPPENSILFLARMAPSKRPDMALDALARLGKKSMPFKATFIGSPRPEDEGFYEDLRTHAPQGVKFVPGIPNIETPNAYRAHAIFVNASRSGMFDKTLFEAAACGCLVLAASEDFRDLAGPQHHFTDVSGLAALLEHALVRTGDERIRDSLRMQALARNENLATLCDRLVTELYSPTP